MWILDIIVEMIGYNTARILLPAVSFGKWRVQRVFSRSPQDESVHIPAFNWFGVRPVGEKNVEVEATMAGWIGTLVWIIFL